MTFGDFDDDDAFDLEPADPEQVAIKLQQLRFAHGISPSPWEGLSPAERAVRVLIIGLLLAWLRRQGAN